MKTFKQHINEKWIRSGEGKWISGFFDIYKNPRGKEMKKLASSTRGFIAPNGDVYVINDGIHADLAILGKNDFSVRKSLPIIFGDFKKKPMEITIGDYTENTVYKDTPIETTTMIIKDNPWIKRTFGKVKVKPRWE